MSRHRIFAISYIAVLGLGVLLFMALGVWLGAASIEGGGWLTAGFLALREIISKIENIALGMRLSPDDEPELEKDGDDAG